MRITVNIKDPRWKKYKIDFKAISAAEAATTADATAAPTDGEISITLTNDKEIRKLNKKYRGVDAPTNVLSFETGDKELPGDVLLSFDAVEREAGEKNFTNRATHLIVHGILHLRGMTHENDTDARIMENMEIKILKKMGMPDPYKNGWAHRAAAAVGLMLLGALAALGFAPYYIFPATVISIGAAYWLRLGYRGGFWWGAGYGLASFHWALESIFANAELARQFWHFYPIGMILLAIGSGLIFGLPFFMTNKTGSTGWRRTLYFALAWTFTLWHREWFLTGFPWNPVANITLPFEKISGLMSIFGALGLTFIIIGCTAAIAEYIKTKSKWQLLFFAPLLICFALPTHPTQLTDMTVRLVQPAFDMNRKFDKASAEDNIRRLTELSKSPSDKKPDLIIWPETAYPYAIDERIDMPAPGSPLAAGVVYVENLYSEQGPNIYNAMVLTDKDGKQTDKYFKVHLVPFGEYRPLGDWIPTPGRLTKGENPKIMNTTKGSFAPAICYEIVFSDSLIPDETRPDFILNITNDAWFGTSIGPHQHLDMARRQAIETGLPVIRANQGGISAILDSRGRVIGKLDLNVSGILDGQVPVGYITIYRRLGLNVTMFLIIILCGIILVIASRQRRRGNP
ncbi:MAG: apolipoprotein N-acyltransferase [Rickettsiales bacterium]|jgi:apolipoprotein N-acyltransferase|nr:apolipoprotein N-acyltransferase [Rickettsiales bacterium]